MKIFALLTSAVNPIDNEVHLYTRIDDMSSFSFTKKGPIKESFKFLARESIRNLKMGTRYSVPHNEFVVHIIVSPTEQFAFYAFSDSEYPRRVAYQC